MAFGFTSYVDPGSYQQEVIVPSGINIPAQPFAVCLVGTASRNKRVSNEAVLRGVVKAESISPAVNSPHTVMLANRSDKKLESTTVYKTLNGIRQTVPDAYVSFSPAYIQGTVATTVAATMATNNAFALEMDGLDPVTIRVEDLVSYVAGSITFGTITDNQVTLTRASATFLADGIKPGMTCTIANSEDAANDGDYIVVSVPAATQVTLAKVSGDPVAISASPDTAMTLAFSGTGFVGREITTLYNVSSIAAVTMVEMAAIINQALAAAGDLGYGAAYANVASVNSTFLRITSPLSTPSSDVRVFAPFANSALVNIFGAASTGNRDAQSALVVADAVWHASATWTVDYVRVDDDTDPLLQTANVQSLVSVGSSPGGTNFLDSVDRQLTSNEVDWSPVAAATTATSTYGLGEMYDLSGGQDQLALKLDGLYGAFDTNSLTITIDLVGMVDPPVGYTDPADPANATAAEVSNNINAVLAAALGPRYGAVAAPYTVNGTPRVGLTSPVEGQATSSISVVAAASGSAHTAIFGGVVGPVMGTGKRPAPGDVYFVTYEYTRPASDYEVPFRHFSVESALALVGSPSAAVANYNPLAIAAQLAFDNGANYIYTVQVDDSSEGNPSRAEVLAALNGAGSIAGTTEVVVVGEPGTRLDVTTDMMTHLETQCGPIEKHYRRIFCGMASGTAIGDRDTADSIVGRATRTLQVAPSSPARGRMFLIAPPQQSGVTKLVTLDDGVKTRVDLDATYLAVAVAARRTALAGPAETLTRRTITGFDTDNITTPWKPAERRALAGAGVLVITYDAGQFKMLDAMSTEGGGGGKTSFQVDSTSYQKDVIVTKVNQALDANIVGIVPYDLASFILDIKLVIQGVIAGEISKGTIGPYRDKETGAARSIDMRTDIRVAQNVNVPTEFNFAYWFNLRYPALRLLGEYSVDNPFFALAS